MDKKDELNHVITMQDDSVACLYDNNAYRETINNIRYFMDLDLTATTKALHARLDRMLTSDADFEKYLSQVRTLSKTLFNLNKLMANHLPVTVIDHFYFTGKYESLRKNLDSKKISPAQFDKEANKLAKEFANSLKVSNETNLRTAKNNGLDLFNSNPELAKPNTKAPSKNK